MTSEFFYYKRYYNSAKTYLNNSGHKKQDSRILRNKKVLENIKLGKNRC